MQTSEFPAFSAMIALTAEHYGKTLSPEMLRFYFDGLKHLELNTVRDALNKHIRNTDTGQFIPKVADVIRAAEGSSEDAAYRALRELQRAFSDVGSWSSVSFADKTTQAVVADMGGWPELCARDSEEWQQFGAREFIRRYRAYAQCGDARDTPAHLPGWFERLSAFKSVPTPEPVRKIGEFTKRLPSREPGAD